MALDNYQHRGARALVLLHDKNLREFLTIWKKAKAANLRLPETSSEDYQSLETLLVHVLDAARSYMLWICRQLDLADPAIHSPPEVSEIEAQVEVYLEHLLERWCLPLINVEEHKFYNPEYPTSSGTHHLCIDLMLEHALVHPARHAFQLEELLKQQRSEHAPS